MKKSDIAFLLCTVVILLPFFMVDSIQQWFLIWSKEHAIIMSFLKFAILATFGEVIGLRIRNGVYNEPNFGIIPRAVIWGFLGITIKMAMDIFLNGTIAFISNLGLEYFKGQNLALIFSDQTLSATKILLAFSISVTMNLIYAPVLMTLHKITDTHIINNGGKISSLFKPIQFGTILPSINWSIMWNFVFKKTIPLFWIPAHTITFLLPQNWRVLFAASLSVALGIFLATASAMSRKK